MARLIGLPHQYTGDQAMTFRRALCAAFFALASTWASAQGGDAAYPSRPIRMLVPLSPGTTTDIVARRFADALAKRLGQSVIVDNKPGAGGTLAAAAAAKSPADGYTILFVNSQHAINPYAYASLPYDTLRDFTGIAQVGEAPSVIAVPSALGVKTLGEFVALAKKQPGHVNYGSSGIGSQTHLAAALFAKQTGITLTHVPYKSASEVIGDLVSNRIQSVFVPAAFVVGQVQSGKLRALAVSSRERLPLLRDVPTAAEAGVPNYEYTTFFGFVAPAKTPPQIVAALAKAMQATVEDPTERQKLAEQGITPRVRLQGDFDAFVKSEMDRLAPVVKATGVNEKQ
jgi:tripartite-type tricarboxylate transporter receptor subunit TctC